MQATAVAVSGGWNKTSTGNSCRVTCSNSYFVHDINLRWRSTSPTYTHFYPFFPFISSFFFHCFRHQVKAQKLTQQISYTSFLYFLISIYQIRNLLRNFNETSRCNFTVTAKLLDYISHPSSTRLGARTQGGSHGSVMSPRIPRRKCGPLLYMR